MTATTDTADRRPLRAGRRRHRHADPRRPDGQRQHDERALPGVDGRRRRPPVRRAGRRHRRRGREREEDVLRRRQPQGHGPGDPDDAAESSRWPRASRPRLRRLEIFPRPVVAAINGAALGGGYEITLACNHRIIVDDHKAEIGLPEASLGLLPGGGGVTRVVRMLGIQSALMDVLLQGTRFKPAEAAEKGLVDELVATREELVPAAKAWIKANPEAAQNPWDDPATRCPAAPRATPSSRRSCRRSRPCCASRPRARSTPPSGRSCRRPSRARRSTSTPRRGSSRAT